MSNPDREYLEGRRAQALAQAEEATDPSVARIHYDFADAYQERLDAIGGGLAAPGEKSRGLNRP